MEDSVSAVKDQSSASGRAASKLLRYPLRSATKPEKKALVSDSPNSVSASKRAVSNVSKSVSALHLSGKEKSSAKPPRRLSIPSKSSNVRPEPKPLGNITPISELRAKRTATNQGKTDAALSDVSKSFSRKKVNDLSSATYWLSHIKLSESAAKHSVSLGFFKLALEAGCEPMQKMSDELTSYVQRYNLSEPGELIKEMLESYKASETMGQSKISETSSQVSAEGINISDHDIHGSSSSVTEAENLMPKSLETGGDEVNQAKKANANNTAKIDSVKKTISSVTKNVAISKAGSEVRKSSTLKKPQKPMKQEAPSKKDKIKQEKKSAKLAEGTPKSEPDKHLKENKENMDVPQTEEVISAEA